MVSGLLIFTIDWIYNTVCCSYRHWGSKTFSPGANSLHSYIYTDNFIILHRQFYLQFYLLTKLHSEVTIKAEVLYRYIMCDDAVAQSSSAEMNRVLTAQRQSNESHGKDATLVVICFPYLFWLSDCLHVLLTCHFFRIFITSFFAYLFVNFLFGSMKKSQRLSCLLVGFYQFSVMQLCCWKVNNYRTDNDYFLIIGFSKTSTT